MKIKNLLVTTLAVAAGLTLTACQSDKSEGASTSQEGEAVTLNFGAMGSIDTIPFVIAQENGYFEEEGIDTEGMKGDDILKAEEVFDVGDGRYLIVEG